ncbi:MAG: PH domain-containing protein [Rhodococcus sp.]|uniref:PH domain-containing protein n=1 Tax=Rhodococcus TaxID=1827 RepID=UPI0016B429D9|nr:PH domain-containing protein [Rhodococcus sp. (in: high G+C Gram-positive bacteria)]NLV80353.1 PH domain-containing protein [Rhodococcus sp. (in: high G+C Gram-positive bacteria)]
MPPQQSSHTPDPAGQVIQVSRLSLLACGLLLLGALSPALAWPAAFGWLVLLPFLAAAWVLRVRTVLDADGITARNTFSTTTIGWGALEGIRFPKRGWARAVLTDGTEVALPVVTFGRLPQLAEASGGRITDPYAAAREARIREDEERRDREGDTTGNDAPDPDAHSDGHDPAGVHAPDTGTESDSDTK